MVKQDSTASERARLRTWRRDPRLLAVYAATAQAGGQPGDVEWLLHVAARFTGASITTRAQREARTRQEIRGIAATVAAMKAGIIDASDAQDGIGRMAVASAQAVNVPVVTRARENQHAQLLALELAAACMTRLRSPCYGAVAALVNIALGRGEDCEISREHVRKWAHGWDRWPVWHRA